MPVHGWSRIYAKIAREFGYDRRLDYEAAIILDSLIGRTVTNRQMEKMIGGRPVFVVGAGPSLGRAVSALRQFGQATTIAADSATRHLLHCGIMPDVIVTDLDGDEGSLRRCGATGTILAVHAHGDNIQRLYIAKSFENYLGTAQSRPYGSVQNFGGFTDGDRAVFLASHFKARKIVLFGMDYDGTIGRFSGTRAQDAELKLRKLKRSAELLSWLSERTASELFTTSSPVRGFQKIRYADLEDVLLE